jgi:hypothetical protein
LIHQLAEGGENGRGRDIVPHIVRPEMHDHDVRIVGRKPAGQEVLVRHIGRQIAVVAFLVAVESQVAGRRPGLGADKIDIGIARALEPVPKDGAPTARRVGDGVAYGHDPDGGGQSVVYRDKTSAKRGEY